MLEKHLKSRPAVKAVKISSYAGMRNSGSVAWEGDCGDFQPDVPVLVVDDVLDTGATLDEVCRELKRRGVKEVLTAVAVDKHCCRTVPFEADYVAFTQGIQIEQPVEKKCPKQLERQNYPPFCLTRETGKENQDMKINRARQQESVAVFGRETSLIRDVLDNLELEHALTWLLEAISQHQSGKMGGEPWHLYQTTLFAMYVDYDNGKVRLSAALACHDADLEMSSKDFVEILSREAVKEAAPLHYTPGSSGKCIHRYRNPYFKRRRRDREPDIGFYS